jgi:hypothetical protein
MSFARVIFIVALLFCISACEPVDKGEESFTIVPNSADLAPGKSAIRGTVHWKGAPIAGIKVILCDHVKSSMELMAMQSDGFSCKEQAESVTTDENGVYSFNNLEPAYASMSTNSNASSPPADSFRPYIPVAVVEGEPRLYFYWESTSGSSPISTTHSIYPDANKTYEVKPFDIHKNDLNLTSPANGEKITERRPALTWDEYPDAAKYSVRLAGNSDSNRGTSYDLDSDQPGARPKTDLPFGKYRWTVRADDAKYNEVAESGHEKGMFEVVAQLPSPTKMSR